VVCQPGTAAAAARSFPTKGEPSAEVFQIRLGSRGGTR
jgi:hypothetical protein